jgi:cell wall-associated NlpC family hydrolase
VRGSPPVRRPSTGKGLPLRPLRHLLVIGVLLGVALGGVDPLVAGAARVESLVEDYNQAREDLARARAEQADTRKRVLDPRRLRAARKLLGRRLWTIYTGGVPSTLGQLLAADSVHQALVTTKYQEQVVGGRPRHPRPGRSPAPGGRGARRQAGRPGRAPGAPQGRLAAERAARSRAAAAARAGRWWAGGSGPSSYDCSGLVMAAYRGAGCGCRG